MSRGRPNGGNHPHHRRGAPAGSIPGRAKPASGSALSSGAAAIGNGAVGNGAVGDGAVGDGAVGYAAAAALHDRSPRQTGAALPMLLLLALAVAALAPAPVQGGVFLSRAEALELAFPGCAVNRQVRYLTPAQQSAAQRTAGTDIDSRLVVRYAATCNGQPGGAAYLDAHRVRTLPETLMVVVGADGRVDRVEVLSFQEPEEYIPRRNWYDLFLRRRLDPELKLKRSIHAVTGATLTARATTDAVRRVLALHEVLDEKESTGASTP